MFNFARDLHVSGRDHLRNVVRIFFLIVSLTAWNGERLTAQFKATAPMLHSTGPRDHIAGTGAAGFFAASATETALTVSPSSPVTVGTPITLTATVTTGGNPVSLGTINFCDATATYCEDSALLGTAQLTTAGTASIKLRLGIGTHSVKASFAGTNGDTSSLSSAQSVTVTGTYPTATTIGYSGMAGNYTLTATVAGSGDAPDGLTGSLSFEDTTNGDSVLGTATLGGEATALFQSFAPPGSYSVGKSPYSVAVGDFNGDGKPDLVIADFAGSTADVLLGNGDGTFQNPKVYSSGGESDFVVVGDFNGDGKLDLAVADYSYSTVSILLGNGDGTFQSRKPYVVGALPDSVAVGDFNRDGKLDLVVANDNGTVSVLLGNGDGTFQNQKVYTVGAHPGSVAVGDFNGDGALDLVVTNSGSNTVGILLGNGDGTFQSQSTYATEAAPISVAVADLNGDGNPDLAVANADGTMSIFLGNGDGAFFQSPETYVWGSALFPTAVASIVVSDFNSDGKPDLVVTDGASSNTVVLFLGNGDGTFEPPESYQTVGFPLSAAVGDFNGDGEPDLAAGSPQGLVSVLLDQVELITTSQLTGVSLSGTGIHEVDARYSGNANYGPSNSDAIALSAGHATATKTSLSASSNAIIYRQQVTLTATVTAGGSLVSLGTVSFCDATATYCAGAALLGTAQLTASGTASVTLALGIGVHSINAVFIGTDVAVSSVSSPQTVTVTGKYPAKATLTADRTTPGVYTFMATVIGTGDDAAGPTGNVSFFDTTGNALLGAVALEPSTPAQSFITETPYAPGSTYSVAVADFNGDGKPDLVVTNTGGYTLTILLGNGDGTFQNPVSYATGWEPWSVATGDFNHDGKIDLVVVNSGDKTTSVLLGNGDGTFQSQTTYATGLDPSSVVVGDFNRDGKPDLVVVNRGDSTIGVFLGNGNGTFQSQKTYAVPGAFSVAVGDFNGDGNADLVLANYDRVSILLNNGDGTFQPPRFYPAGNVALSAAVGDFNGDGRLDFAVANFESDTVGVFLGNGDGTFQNQKIYAAGSGPSSATVGDFNGDGKLDLAVANGNVENFESANTVSILLGNGDGTFQNQKTYAAGTNPASIVTGDFNGDGWSDLALGSANLNSGNSVTVLLNQVTQTATAQLSGVSFASAATHELDSTYSGDTNYAGSTSNSITLIIPGPATTTTTLGATPKAVVGGPVTLNASVWSPLGRPTGSVTFLSGGTTLGTAPLNDLGVASLITTFLPVGTDSVTASYDGFERYEPSTSPAVNVVILQLGTTTTLLATPKAVLDGPVTLNASVWSSLGRPTGTVTFQSGGMTLGTAMLNSLGAASLITTKLSLGTDSVTASYGGSGGYESSTSPAANVVINPAPTTMTMVQTVGVDYCGVAGDQVTLVATVKSQLESTPSGTVTFLNYGKVLGTVSLNSSGVATFTTPPLPLGYNLLMADYAGQGNFASSAAHPILDILIPKGITSTTLRHTPKSIVGGPVVLNVSVREVSEATPPVGGPITGSVTIQAGSMTLATLPLNSALDASLVTTLLPVGTNTVTAIYPGNPCVTASASPPVTVVVSPEATTTALTVSAPTVTAGATVTLTATLHSQQGAPSGTVTFLNHGVSLGTALLNNSGVATLTTTSLPVGDGSLKASYGGSTNFAASISPAVRIAVTTPAGTTTTLLATPRAVVGAPVTLNASVRSLRSGLPSGTVTFQTGSTTLGTLPLNSSADASLITTSLPPGTAAVTASYGGSVNFEPSTSPAVNVIVSPAATKPALRASPPR